ncbi:ABC transporter permease [Cytophagaceae bacterium DM2B3-1]|uniref:ABC transporter permease n=1 Tax=Xanthocytophaga flava TaxID=3048013 RepID=A0ABT7CYW1_9BACT|nr:ABC transporter permease [Xanthocytophaga flavus]MDJ1498681.1 ABC transporter permease [Xanthocytophaga flavus]
MLYNYLKIAFRNLVRNRVYSLINIGGLAIGLACCICIGLYIWDEYSYDRFHTGYKDIYRVVEKQTQAGATYKVAVTPGPLATALQTDFAEVKQTCRIGRIWYSGVLQTPQASVEPEDILVTDNSFFHLFDFKLLRGNSGTVLSNPDDIVITPRIAAQLFGSDWRQSDSLIGTMLTFPNGRTLTVAGVAAPPPTNSHIQFDALLSAQFDRLDTNSGNYTWDNNAYHTYILLNSQARTEPFAAKLYHYLDKFTSNTDPTTLSLQPLSDIYLHSDFDFQSDWSKTSNSIYIRIFLTTGSIVLLIALFNFVNLSTARAMKRAREVGVRKAIGAVKNQLVIQFMGEAIGTTFIAVGVALLLVQLFLPAVNDISGKLLQVPFQDTRFCLTLFVFTFLTGVLAGIYPALHLSDFQPVVVLKSFSATHSGKLLRQSIVVAQFSLSVVLMVSTIVIYKQLTFIQNKNLGFDKSQLLYVRLKNELRAKGALIKAELKKQASIAQVTTTSGNLVDLNTSTDSFQWEGQPAGDRLLITHMNIDPDFLATTGMTLVAGRNFSASRVTDTSSAYILNEAAAKRMGWTAQQALGKKLQFWNRQGQVIGVVKDFHFHPVTTSIEPFVFRYWPQHNISGLFVKVHPYKIHEAIQAIEEAYKVHNSQTAPYYEFVDQSLNSQYRTEQNTARIVFYFAVLTILVSCLGLFGLATYMAEQRIKEIGIRKVLGASVPEIVNLLSKDLLKLVGIGIGVASPIAWYVMNQWLQNFAYRIEIEWWMFGIVGGVAIVIALLTISLQSIRAALVNPVHSLRSE